MENPNLKLVFFGIQVFTIFYEKFKKNFFFDFRKRWTNSNVAV